MTRVKKVGMTREEYGNNGCEIRDDGRYEYGDNIIEESRRYSIRWVVQSLRALCENFAARFRYRDTMFKLRR